MTAPSADLTSALSERYRIERELGRGGMATVFRAMDLKHDRPVALKVLNPEMTALLGAERFHQEIRVTARLRHPNILPLYDSGEAAGALYYVMPLVEGESLRARLDRKPPLTPDETIALAREVADALDYAHRHGVIHRDIKPENILLENGHALVADFGIAKARAGGDSRLTQPGFSMGTPLYMSPEQASGDPDADGRSDLYSLACVVYEMLAGAPPFEGASPEAILVQRFTKAAPRLSIRRPSVPAGIDRALQRAMARNPSDRFPSTAAFAAALESPSVAAPLEKSIAVLPFTCMSVGKDTEYFGDGIAEEIINALTQLPGLKVAARTSTFSFKGKEADLRAIADKLGVSTVLEGSFRQAGNRIRVTAQLIEAATGYHLWSERYDRELTDIFAIQDEIANAIAEKLKVTLASGEREPLVRPGTSNIEAYDCYLKGRLAMRHRGSELAKAIDWFERSLALDPDFAPAHAGLTQALALSAFWGIVPTQSVRERAIAAAERAMALDPNLPESVHAEGFTALFFHYDRERASRAWLKAIELDPKNPDSHILRGVFDFTYVRLDVEGAERELRTAIELDPESAYAHTGMAVSLTFGHRSLQGLPFAERAVALDPNSLYAHWVRMLTLALLGRLEEVLESSRALSARFGRHPWILMAISLASGIAGDTATSEAVYQELKGRSVLEHIQRIVLAVGAIYSGRREEAYEQLRAAAREREALLAALILDWPGLAPLRGTAEYDQILRSMGWKP